MRIAHLQSSPFIKEPNFAFVSDFWSSRYGVCCIRTRVAIGSSQSLTRKQLILSSILRHLSSERKISFLMPEVGFLNLLDHMQIIEKLGRIAFLLSPRKAWEWQIFLIDLSPLLSVYLFKNRLANLYFPLLFELYIFIGFAMFKWLLHVFTYAFDYFKREGKNSLKKGEFNSKSTVILLGIFLFVGMILFGTMILIVLGAMILPIIFIEPLLMTNLFSGSKSPNLWVYLASCSPADQLTFAGFFAISLSRHGFKTISFLQNPGIRENLKKKDWIYFGRESPPAQNEWIEINQRIRAISKGQEHWLSYLGFFLIAIAVLLSRYSFFVIYLYFIKAFIELRWDRMHKPVSN